MDGFLTSIPLVAIAEMGDKTQLLALMLVLHYRRALPVIAGIAAATVANHAVSAWLGVAAASYFQLSAFSVVIGVAFILIGLWMLKPDRQENLPAWLSRFSAFGASTIAFFFAEIGDKTQLLTVTLAAEYHSFLWVTLGTTLGMLVANIPVVFLGNAFLRRLPMHLIRQFAALVFICFGVAELLGLC